MAATYAMAQGSCSHTSCEAAATAARMVLPFMPDRQGFGRSQRRLWKSWQRGQYLRRMDSLCRYFAPRMGKPPSVCSVGNSFGSGSQHTNTRNLQGGGDFKGGGGETSPHPN